MNSARSARLMNSARLGSLRDRFAVCDRELRSPWPARARRARLRAPGCAGRLLGPGRGLAGLGRRRGRVAPLAAHADRPRERGPPRARLELPHRGRRRREPDARQERLRGDADPRRGHALLLLALQPRLRARRRDRQPALGLRSEGRARAPLAARLSGRRALERRRARSRRAVPAPDLHRHRRRAPAGAGCRERLALPRLRRGRQPRPDPRPGKRAARGIRRHLASDTDRGRGGRRRAGGRRAAHRRSQRRGARLRRAQRRAALGLRPGSARDAAAAARRGRHAALAPGNPERLVGLLRRPRARSAVRADGQREPGFLRRPAGRARSLLELAGRAARRRRARWSGASRPFTTISGTSTSPRSRR